MTLKELEIFYTLIKTKHMTKAANELNITQSAVSLALKSLEKKVGERLFDRIGKKLVLNEYGRVFYNETYKCFEKLKETQNIFLKNKLIGEIKIASSKTYGNFLMPKKIVSFLNQNPSVKIKHFVKNSCEIVDMVYKGEIDCGVIETEIDEVDLFKEKIGNDSLVIVSREKIKNEVFIDTLFNKKWILREKGSGTREMFLNAIKDIKKELNIFLECREIEEIKQFLLEDKDIISCISELAIKEELKNSRLFKINVKNLNLKRNFYLIYHKNKYQSRLFLEFKKHLKQ
jgi:DNA-binding transcriptional LysR family regulator